MWRTSPTWVHIPSTCREEVSQFPRSCRYGESWGRKNRPYFCALWEPGLLNEILGIRRGMLQEGWRHADRLDTCRPEHVRACSQAGALLGQAEENVRPLLSPLLHMHAFVDAQLHDHKSAHT